jgi:hypothetical protein
MNTLKTKEQKQAKQLEAKLEASQKQYALESIHPIWFWIITIGALILVSLIEKL